MGRFRPVDPKVDLPALEERILEFWHEAGIFEKSVRMREGGPGPLVGAGDYVARVKVGTQELAAIRRELLE